MALDEHELNKLDEICTEVKEARREIGEVRQDCAVFEERTNTLQREMDRRHTATHERINRVEDETRDIAKRRGGVAGSIGGGIGAAIAIAWSVISGR